MWPAILAFARAYAPYIVMPAAGVVGFIGYNIEDWLSDKYTPFQESTIDRRDKRRLEEGETEYKVPASIFEKNVSPALEKKS